MAIGAPGTRLTPDPSAAVQGHGHWGGQPSGPLLNYPRNPKPHRGAMLRTAVTGTPQADAALPAFLPKAATLDYAHKLTTTTLLLLGVIGYLAFGPKRAPAVLSQLASRHVA